MSAIPLVEVVIPTYNQASLLRHAIDSLCSQTFRNWTATVINNFSTDETVDIVSNTGDSRIKLVNFQNEGSIAASRNIAIRATRAEYIAFLDSDDWWRPTKLARCIEVLQAEADLVCHAEEWVGRGDTRIVKYGPATMSDFRNLLLRGNCLSTSAVMVKTEAVQRLGGFSEDRAMITAEDYDLWLRLSKDGLRFRFIDEVLGSYRIHATSASSSVERHFNAEWTVVTTHLRDAGINGLLHLKRLALVHYSAGRSAYRSKLFTIAGKHLLLAAIKYPFSLRIYAAMALVPLKWLITVFGGKLR